MLCIVCVLCVQIGDAGRGRWEDLNFNVKCRSCNEMMGKEKKGFLPDKMFVPQFVQEANLWAVVCVSFGAKTPYEVHAQSYKHAWRTDARITNVRTHVHAHTHVLTYAHTRTRTAHTGPHTHTHTHARTHARTKYTMICFIS